MKLVKAMKKLKFWSTKNKNKKNDYYYRAYQNFQPPYYPPPPPLRPAPLRPPLSLPSQPPLSPPPSAGGAACQCHFCHQVEPSAPPLPPWLESQLIKSTHDGISGPDWTDPFLGPTQQEDDQCITISQEIVANTTPPCPEVPELPIASSSSYQQYMAADPAYDLPLLPRRDRAAGGLFGCAMTVGSLFARCFCPCFHISQYA